MAKELYSYGIFQTVRRNYSKDFKGIAGYRGSAVRLYKAVYEP